MKLLFHSRLLDMRLVIANSALRASLAVYPAHIQEARMEQFTISIEAARAISAF